LEIAGSEAPPDRRRRRQLEASGAGEDGDHSPRAGGDLVLALQRGGQRVLIEGPRGADELEAIGKLGTVTERALEGQADVLTAAVGGLHPRTVPERRAVPDVLSVQARQLGDPVAVVVLVEAVDRPEHEVRRR
jgi:hypothetical protein